MSLHKVIQLHFSTFLLKLLSVTELRSTLHFKVSFLFLFSISSVWLASSFLLDFNGFLGVLKGGVYTLFVLCVLQPRMKASFLGKILVSGVFFPLKNG